MSQPFSPSSALDALTLSTYLRDWEIRNVQPHGKSTFGASGYRITAKSPSDGLIYLFFLKAFPTEESNSRPMAISEYESMKAIFAVHPKFVPRPLELILSSEPAGADGGPSTSQTHSLLFEFLPFMADEKPLPEVMAEHLAKVHRDSKSPTGKFGFHVTTYPGSLPQTVEWEDSWEVFFTKSLRHALDMEIRTKGQDEALDRLIPPLFDTVIPRLLRPLETGGRKVKPCLVHGDLWYGNSGVTPSRSAIVFDAACIYAHNEYEFGQWRPACNKFGPEYLDAYHEIVPKSEPVEDYDGRLDLYKLKFNTHVSALFPDKMDLREQMLGDMKDLVERYGTRDLGPGNVVQEICA